MFIDFLINIFEQNKQKNAFIWKNTVFTYGELLENYAQMTDYVTKNDIEDGTVVAVEGDFSPLSTALILTLIEKSCIVVPLTESVKHRKNDFLRIAQVQTIITFDKEENISINRMQCILNSEILNTLKECKHPGLILFSSGSTGQCKAAVHDFASILEKYKTLRKTKKMLTFLMFDHIGGINTLLHNLSNAGCVITVQDRSPDGVLAIVEKYSVEVLPVSPTFINLILLSEAYKNYDLSSLEVVSYGTEVMPESTLERFHKLFPHIRLLQTYGLSELGIMRSKSESSDSLWVKVGGEGFETRIVDGMLEIKARSAMLGYLNAPSPFTEDGWFKTGDAVETKGEYYKFLGRKSELINVGGEKVYPTEIESVIMQMDGVKDIAVRRKKHPFIGNMVFASVNLSSGESLSQFRIRMRAYCKGKLDNFKIPQKVALMEGQLHSNRFKKIRK